jgi:sensor histidine kinase YesM
MNFGDDMMDCLIPKLLLQPLLENAIKHGFGTKEKLLVTISGYKITDKLVVVCEDDGAGIAADKLKEIQEALAKDDNETAHYGLYNIHRRIKLMYKGNYGLDIDSKEGEGPLVRIVLPKRER